MCLVWQLVCTCLDCFMSTIYMRCYVYVGLWGWHVSTVLMLVSAITLERNLWGFFGVLRAGIILEGFSWTATLSLILCGRRTLLKHVTLMWPLFNYFNLICTKLNLVVIGNLIPTSGIRSWFYFSRVRDSGFLFTMATMGSQFTIEQLDEKGRSTFW